MWKKIVLYSALSLLVTSCVTVNVADENGTPVNNSEGLNDPSQVINFNEGDDMPADTTNASQKDLTTVNELQIEDIQSGSGEEAVEGKTVSVHYTGTLTNGEKFDSSLDRNEPFSFVLGSGQVIEGWEQGIIGMKVGGKRKLTIPSELGYGEQGSPPVIPPNATLVFDVELLSVK